MREPSKDDFLNDEGLKDFWLVRLMLPFVGTIIPVNMFYRLALKLEGGEFFSRSLRVLLWKNGIKAEAYSYGSFHVPGTCEPGLSIGRYASIARGVRWGHNHPSNRIALSPLFYVSDFGIVDETKATPATLEIGPDAWIGGTVVITTGCKRIGVGAIVGAGSVVTHDVPDFAIVYGSPARIKRYRFDEPIRRALLNSRWWELSPRALKPWLRNFGQSADSPGTLVALTQIGQIVNNPIENV
jgi:virginiamycin A acetyltransferase